MNKSTLLGIVVNDPKTGANADGKPWTQLRIKTMERGRPLIETYWAYGKQADIAAKYIKKLDRAGFECRRVADSRGNGYFEIFEIHFAGNVRNEGESIDMPEDAPMAQEAAPAAQKAQEAAPAAQKAQEAAPAAQKAQEAAPAAQKAQEAAPAAVDERATPGLTEFYRKQHAAEANRRPIRRAIAGAVRSLLGDD